VHAEKGKGKLSEGVLEKKTIFVARSPWELEGDKPPSVLTGKNPRSKEGRDVGPRESPGCTCRVRIILRAHRKKSMGDEKNSKETTRKKAQVKKFWRSITSSRRQRRRSLPRSAVPKEQREPAD